MKKYLLPQFIIVTLIIIVTSIVLCVNYEIGATILFLILSLATLGLTVHGTTQFVKTNNSNNKQILHD